MNDRLTLHELHYNLIIWMRLGMEHERKYDLGSWLLLIKPQRNSPGIGVDDWQATEMMVIGLSCRI